MRNRKIQLFMFMVVFLQGLNLFSQNVSETKREEIHRYFGYDDLLTGYLTLPVDVSMNTNEKGYFSDIGFLLIILLPILALLYLRKRDYKLTYIFAPILALIYLLYTSNSFILSNELRKINPGNIYDYTRSSDSLLEALLGQIYIITNNLSGFLNNTISIISGSHDYITYPILIITLLLLLFVFNSSKTKSKFLFTLFLTFSFFWLILSAGIIWYGYLAFPLAYLLVTKLIDLSENKWTKNSAYSLIGFWILIAIVARISNISMHRINENSGKNFINPVFFSRSLGTSSNLATTNLIHPGLYEVQQQINLDENSLIYRVGTTLSYFINNNSKRVLFDNQLGFFDSLISKYPSQLELTKALKSSGFKYLMVDLNTHTLDRTPERSLTKKFQKLLGYVNNNSELQLLATDRMVENPVSGTNNAYIYDVFGSNVVQPGSYAIYKIL